MIRAYSEMYLDDAMSNLGEALDYAVNSYHMKADDFMDRFIVSSLAAQFEKGVPGVVSGMSGTELVLKVLEQSESKDENFPEPQTEYDCSAEYWCGWILAYYQWYTGQSFRDILKIVPMSEIERMYPALHEASEDKFADVVGSRIQNKKMPTKLQLLRKCAGYSQRELAEKSGVNLRTLQQYELRSKSINKASARILLALARTLGCSIEDLMEYEPETDQ